MKPPSTVPLERRRRLGAWLPEPEAKLGAFRQELVAQALARQRRAPGSATVQALAQLIDSDPMLRMHLTRAIEEAQANGYVPGSTATLRS